MNVIIAVDLGSSSVKCSAYAFSNKNESNNGESRLSSSPPVMAISGAHASKSMRAVCPHTGHIENVNELLVAADQCLENVLSVLHSSKDKNEYKIVAVGFSSFSMNLVGINAIGAPVGKEATMTYACNTDQVVQEVDRLKR